MRTIHKISERIMLSLALIMLLAVAFFLVGATLYTIISDFYRGNYFGAIALSVAVVFGISVIVTVATEIVLNTEEDYYGPRPNFPDSDDE